MAEFQMIIKERRRMCDSFHKCMDCPLGKAQPDTGSCKHWTVENPEEAERIIMEWSKEHPAITNRRKFEEVFGHDITSMLEISCHNSACLSAWLDEEYKEKNVNE